MADSGARADKAPRLARARLTERLAKAHVATAFAPSGYGKSLLIDELAVTLGWTAVRITPQPGVSGGNFVAPLRRGLRSAGLPVLADAIKVDSTSLETVHELLTDRADPVLFAVDEAHRLTDEDADELGAFASLLPSRHHLVIAGQAHPPWSSGPRIDLSIGTSDLALTASEVGELAGLFGRDLDDADVQQLLAATSGWPAAVGLAVASGVIEPARLGMGIAPLVQKLLADSSEPARAAAARLAHLQLLSQQVADAVAGVGALELLEGTGLPIQHRQDGWLAIPDPVRDVLASGTELPPDAALAAAEAYHEAGAPQEAVTLLLGLDRHELLAQSLESWPWQDLQAFDPAELRAISSVIPAPVLDAHPRLLVAMSRVAEAAMQIEWRSSLLDRASATEAATTDPALRRAIDAELAGVAALRGDSNEVERLALSVINSAGEDEVTSRARALATLGRSRAFDRDATSTADATRYLTEALTLARICGERDLMATALLRLGYSVCFTEGDLDAAENRLREAVDSTPNRPHTRATNLTFLADVLIYAGELDEADAALREVASIGRRLRDQGLLGYHGWMKAAVATHRGDAEGLATWLADAERHTGDWFEHPTGIEFLAEAVDMWGRVGDRDKAAEYLRRVEVRCADDRYEDLDQILLVARAVHGARFGNPAEAERHLVATLQTEQLPRRETWRIHLLRGYAALRAGDEARAARHAGRAFEEANALGHPELPNIHEPEITDQLLPLAKRGGSSAAASTDAAVPRISVRVLGDFSVSVLGRPADLPPGRPQTLVKLLATVAGPVSIEEAIEVLWPEVDPETGRARLRNVLARIRSAAGDVVKRDGEALVLGNDVHVDAVEFDREAGAALATPVGSETAGNLARSAIARYAGELLPADRFEDFTVARRERLTMRYLALLERLAFDAEAAGDVDEALRLYADAIAAAPLEEHRYELAAELAIKHGRRQRARELVDQATRMLAELDVEPSPRLAAILARVMGEPTAVDAARPLVSPK